MDEEMRFHIDMEAERLVRERKLDPGEASRQAAAAFGGVETFKEAGRDVRGIAGMRARDLVGDLEVDRDEDLSDDVDFE